jgi:hypothetical protein
MSNSLFVACIKHEGSETAVKVSMADLHDLDEKRKIALELVNSIFDAYQANSSQKNTSDVVVLPLEMEPKKSKTRISSDEFNQACFSCLVEKKNASCLNLCNPTFNKFLPVGYEVGDYVADDQGNTVLIPYLFAAKVSHLQDDRRFTYCIETKTFSLREGL